MLEKMNDFFNSRIGEYEEHQLNAIAGAREFYPFTAKQLPMHPHAVLYLDEISAQKIH